MSVPTQKPSAALLRPALRAMESEEPTSPKSGPAKVVSIAEPADFPLITPDESPRIKQFPTSISAKRLSGRPILTPSSTSRLSTVSNTSLEDFNMPDPMASQANDGNVEHRRHHEHRVHQHDKLLSQVSEWLQKEKAKRAARKSKHRTSKHGTSTVHTGQHESSASATSNATEGKGTDSTARGRSDSHGSSTSEISLEHLQRILEDSMSAFGPINTPSPASSRRASHTSRKKSSRPKLGGTVSSDTEYQDGDVVVPACEVVLDNSKTMSYSGGVADSSSTTVTLKTSRRAERERQAWLAFKTDIVTLTHTLRLKGWRRVPLDSAGDIKVERLSGALTNAVYVVFPPEDLSAINANSTHKHKPPPKLLLRVYGPQVEHLIDRENELGILRRLARKRIGPRLLGTFTNGRFEEYFESKTLTAADLRVPDTSKQIAKRMRELHDGVELLDRERDDGPFVWLNWDKWVGRCEEVIEYLDKDVLSGKKTRGDSKVRGLVCGVEWNVFKNSVDQYRKWLDEKYLERGGVNKSLVFAHNDTQYGNILRLVPAPPTPGSAPSPLLLPQNTHKQLVVIDFEYASANTPGLEFANHFTEWCYNYHDTSKPWACHTDDYPTIEEQRRFVRSYVNHRPQFDPRASATPKLSALDGLAKGSISEFLLDSRTPGGSSANLPGDSYADEEARREKEIDRQVEEILQETRFWRIANSAQWVAWGIVQAKVPELDQVVPDAEQTQEPESTKQANISHYAEYTDDELDRKLSQTHIEDMLSGAGEGSMKSTDDLHAAIDQPDKRPEGLKAEALRSGESVKEAEQLDDEEDEFDYLAYAQDRAMFFWGDLISLGFVQKEKLPERLVQHLKIVDR